MVERQEHKQTYLPTYTSYIKRNWMVRPPYQARLLGIAISYVNTQVSLTTLPMVSLVKISRCLLQHYQVVSYGNTQVSLMTLPRCLLWQYLGVSYDNTQVSLTTLPRSLLQHYMGIRSVNLLFNVNLLLLPMLIAKRQEILRDLF